MLRAESGTSAFLDNLIVVLAARYAAPISQADGSEEDDEKGWDKWEAVAAGVRKMLTMKNPTATASIFAPPVNKERGGGGATAVDDCCAMGRVDALLFTAEVCRHRAQYILWRQQQQNMKKKKRNAAAAAVSGFNVAKGDSLKKEIDLLMEAARSNLPTTQQQNEDDDDDEDNNGNNNDDVDVVVFSHPTATAAADVDVEYAELEDAFHEEVQRLQVDFYKRHKRWIELGPSLLLSSGDKNPSEEKPQQQQENTKMLLSEMTPADVAFVLSPAGRLAEIAEFAGSFRRTDGRLLATLVKEDLRPRFNGDSEALDIFWAWLAEEKKREEDKKMKKMNQQKVDRISSEAAMKEFMKAVGTPSESLQRSLLQLEENQKKIQKQKLKQEEENRHADPIEMLKAAIRDPNRPLRPSEERAAKVLQKKQQQQTAPPPPPAAEAPPPPATTAPVVAAATGRGNRWQVVEYSDDDESD